MASSTSAALRIVFGADTEQLDRALGHLNKQLTRTGKSLTRAGRQMSIGLTAPLVAIGATSFQTAAQFEASMAKVAAVSGATTEEFKTLSDQAKQLGRTTVFTASQVSELQLEFSKLGFTAGQITKVTESTLNLAQATGSDLATSAEVAGATLRGFGLRAEETGRVTDVMAASFSASALDMTSFRESMKYVAPVAKAAGLSLEETTAMLAALANSGVKGSQAGTALRRIISQLGGTGEDVSQQIERLAAEGLNLADAKDEVGRSAQTALLILSEAIDPTRALTEEFANASGASQAMADIMNDTAQGALARMNSAIEGAQIVIGDAMIPTMNAGASAVEGLANAFTELNPSVQKTIVGFGGVLSALGPAVLAAGQLTFAVKNLIPAFAALNRTMRANPIVSIVSVALAAATAIAAYGRSVRKSTKDEKKFGDKVDRTNTFLKDRQDIIDDIGGTNAGKSLASLNAQIDELDANIESLGTEQVNIVASFNALGGDVTMQDLLESDELELAPSIALDLSSEYDRIVEEQGTELGEALDEIFSQGLTQAEEDQKLDELYAPFIEQAVENVAANLRDQKGELEKARRDLKKSLTPDDDDDVEVVIPAKATFELADDFAGGEISKVMDDLSSQLNQISAEAAITGEQAEGLEAMADAYRDAAIAALALNDVETSDFLQGMAKESRDAAQEIRTAASEIFSFDTHLQQMAMTAGTAAVSIGDLLSGLDRVGPAVETATEETEDAADTFADFAMSMKEAVLSFFDAFADNLGNAVEEAVRSGEALQPVGELVAGAAATVLTTLGQIMINVGKTAILTGTAVEGIKKALETLNPALAIAAGIALIALAGAVRGSLAKAADNRAEVPKLARGGITTGETLALIGDNPSGKEAIIPFERMGEFLAMAQPQTQVVVTGRISGQDILLSNERTHSDRFRNAGF